MPDRQPEKEKENFNPSFTELTESIPRLGKHSAWTKVEESGLAPEKSELIAITAAAAVKEFLKM